MLKKDKIKEMFDSGKSIRVIARELDVTTQYIWGVLKAPERIVLIFSGEAKTIKKEFRKYCYENGITEAGYLKEHIIRTLESDKKQRKNLLKIK